MKCLFSLGHWSRNRGRSGQISGHSGLILILGLALIMALAACAGDAGIPVPQGAAGSTGAAGEARPAGSTGERGDTGPDGSPGSAGSAGPIGPTGPEGVQGPPGQTGLSIANVVWMGDPGFREPGDRRNRNLLPNAVQVQAAKPYASPSPDSTSPRYTGCPTEPPGSR